MKIAQIVFEELKSIPSKEKQYKGSYQHEEGTEGALFSSELLSSHVPTDLLNDAYSNSNSARSAFSLLLEGLEK